MSMKRRQHPRPPAGTTTAPPPPKKVFDLERNERHHSTDGTVVRYKTKVEHGAPPAPSDSPFTPPPAGPREYYLVRYVHEDPNGNEVHGGEHHNRLASPAVVASLLEELRKNPQNTKITVYRVTETWERVEFP
jgi:hypothetical protein